MLEPFFLRQDHQFLPQPNCRGPWDPNSLHGRVVAGLLAFAIETEHDLRGFTPARLTVDMYRLPDFSPMAIETRAIRTGKRIRVIDAEVFSGGVSVGRASCQLLAQSKNPPGEIWSPKNWAAPAPHTLPAPPSLGFNMWEMRFVPSRDSSEANSFMSKQAHKQAWLRETRDLVEGVPITPWVRVALAADFASPFANSGSEGLHFINSDMTIYLHRLPRGEWLGFETVNHQATDGVAIGECFLYDEAGPIGSSTVCALAQRSQAPNSR